jgi:hypothetical protein
MKIYPLLPGKSADMVDINGTKLFDGDLVRSISDPLFQQAQIRAMDFNGREGWGLISNMEGGIRCTGLPPFLSHDPKFGVLKLAEDPHLRLQLLQDAELINLRYGESGVASSCR